MHIWELAVAYQMTRMMVSMIVKNKDIIKLAIVAKGGEIDYKTKIRDVRAC